MGPLSGFKVIELAGIGPGPFCGMMLADMGAEVIRVDRTGGQDGSKDILCRSRRSISVNLKNPEGRETILKLCEQADAIFEGFRPGVTERLGLGPEDCMARNEKLVYGRMTGWGQEGPMSQAAGHDINYIALSGALQAIGRRDERPAIPLNLVGDFGGGGMYLAFGLVCGMLEAKVSGKGQVVDAAMVDGASSLMAMCYSNLANNGHTCERESNVLDGASHFYDTYETKDGGYVAIGAIEPQFYAVLLEKTGIDPKSFERRFDKSKWDNRKAELTEIFKSKSRDEWCEIMEGTDACFAPVLSMEEAPQHPHNIHRNTFVNVNGVTHPAPAPRFSRSQTTPPKQGKTPGHDTRSVLSDWGFNDEKINQMLETGAVAQL